MSAPSHTLSSKNTRVVLAAIGPWEHLPELKTRFQLSLEPVESEWREDLIQRGWDLGALPKPQLKVIRAHESVIWAELELEAALLVREGVSEGEGEGAQLDVDLATAREAAWLLRSLAEAGASALYFDPAEKVYAPDALKELPVRDSVALLHLFVDVWGEEGSVSTEGMAVFGCPDVRVEGVDAKSAEAQATAFSAAAQVACEGLWLPEGAEFRASESFPLFASLGVSFEEEPQEQAGELSAHPFGVLRLTLKRP